MTRIVKVCKKCGGSKFKVISVRPVKYKPCSKCQGRGGKMEAKP